MYCKNGFLLVEIALGLIVLGLLVLPLTHALSAAAERRRSAGNQSALTAAHDALLAYAVRHHGCLPDAADFEGAMPDTDQGGNGGYTDTGSVRAAVEPAQGGSGQRAGDIPWADLGLAGGGIDGNNLRLQYYVASPFTAPAQTRLAADIAASRDGCPARLRQTAEAWQAYTPYHTGDVIMQNGQWYVAAADIASNITPPAVPWQAFGNSGTLPGWNINAAYRAGDYATYQDGVYRALADTTGAAPALSPDQWRAVGLPNGGTPPIWQSHASIGYRRGELVSYNGHVFRAIAAQTAPASAPISGTTTSLWEDLTFPGTLAAMRLGPDLSTAPGSTIASPQNVALLIAVGRDRNMAMGRDFVRDATHMACSDTSCTAWNTLNDTNIDTRSFSLTPDFQTTPKSGDTVLQISYVDYQAAMARAGFNVKPVRY